MWWGKKICKNFGSGHIKPTCWNLNVTDWNICHKIYVSQLSILLYFMREFSTLHVFDSPLYSNSWFLTHNWISRICSACICVVTCTTCNQRRLSCWSLPFKLLPVTSCRIHNTSQKDFNENAAHIQCLHWNNSKEWWMGQVKMILSRYRRCLTGLAISYFYAVILSRHFKMTGK